MSACLLIAGGGTGGHLFPGVAVAKALVGLKPDLRVAFVSAGKALESEVLQQAGFPLEALKVRAFVRAGILGRLRSLAALPGALLAARMLLRRYRPGLVLAVGGYAAFPLGLAAYLSGVPLAVQEQNAVPGLTNRLLGKLARTAFISFAAAEASFPKGKAWLTGNPVRLELIEQARQAGLSREDPAARFNVLVLGGSQGAHTLNQALCEALPRLQDRKDRLFFQHQTGLREEENVQAAYRAENFAAEVKAFFPDMGAAYGRAHLVICRAGAGTLSEVLATGRAAVCVPYPYAAGDHQTANARALADQGAAQLAADAEFTGEKAAAVIRQMMDRDELRQDMEAKALTLALPRAAQDIAQRCLTLMPEAA